MRGMDAFPLARGLLARARHVVALTGAGISAESGIPTFRGPGGLWRSHRPEDLATPDAFARDPLLVWQWYDWRRGVIAAATPNPGHAALVRLEARCTTFLLVTQNVDGLHARAGSRNVLHLHGDIGVLRCTRCGAERVDRAAPLPSLPPYCGCGGMERPGVVWFGESLPDGAMDRAADAVARADVVLLVGTSNVVCPAASLVHVAFHRDIPVIEVNPDETGQGTRVIAVRETAGAALPRLID
jgi:NAD-dependent deacetylase